MNSKCILDKVYFLLSISKSGECTDKQLEEIKMMVSEHTEGMVIGRVFGYSVSDYALAALKWIGTDETLREFKVLFDNLPYVRKNEIKELISK